MEWEGRTKAIGARGWRDPFASGEAVVVDSRMRKARGPIPSVRSLASKDVDINILVRRSRSVRKVVCSTSNASKTLAYKCP